MATNFPGSLDSFTNPTSGSTLDSPSHAGQHANINDAMEAVQAKLGTGAGTIGTWTAFTPSWTSLTVGNGTQVAHYLTVNKICFVIGYVQFGTTSAITGSIRHQFPVTIDSPKVLNYAPIGTGVFTTASYWGIEISRYSSSAYFYARNSALSYTRNVNVNATVPDSYTSSTRITYQYYYPIA